MYFIMLKSLAMGKTFCSVKSPQGHIGRRIPGSFINLSKKIFKVYSRRVFCEKSVCINCKIKSIAQLI